MRYSKPLTDAPVRSFAGGQAPSARCITILSGIVAMLSRAYVVPGGVLAWPETFDNVLLPHLDNTPTQAMVVVNSCTIVLVLVDELHLGRWGSPSPLKLMLASEGCRRLILFLIVEVAVSYVPGFAFRA